MILSIPFEEIKTFPKEVRLFLNSYFKKKLSESLKEENQVFLNQTSTLHKPADILEAPIFTRHPSRKLVANNKFDWFKFLSKIIEDKNGKHKYDFHFTVTPKKDTEILLNSNGHNIIHDNPKSWGVVLIFCCMFGFGNKFPGLSVAKTTKDISYNIKKIVTTCPHCFNTIKNEYPSLGGEYKVYHHTQFLKYLLNDGRLKIKGGSFKGKKITYHDPCYLGRANNEYEAPRELIHKLEAELVEMKRCKSNGLCCGAGGAQMFKDAEKGNKEINIERTEDIKETNTNLVATGCPFCNTMLTDGAKTIEDEKKVSVMDISELIAKAQDL